MIKWYVFIQLCGVELWVVMMKSQEMYLQTLKIIK
jgi:hypothetical protein